MIAMAGMNPMRFLFEEDPLRRAVMQQSPSVVSTSRRMSGRIWLNASSTS
jgi:hypothetical protein